MKAKVQVRRNFAKRLSRWLVDAALAASMATPALAVQINGPAQVTDPVFLDPEVTITILDALDVLFNQSTSDGCKKACDANCKEEVERANCYAAFSCDSTNPSPGDTVKSAFKNKFYACDNTPPKKKTSDGGLGQVLPQLGGE